MRINPWRVPVRPALSTLDKLWDTYPPFQIDGNFGATAAIAAMLLHSHNHEIKFLPTLPDPRPDGFVRGLRARGDHTIDVHWQEGTLLKAVVYAGKRAAGPIPVVYRSRSLLLHIEPGGHATMTRESFSSDGSDRQ